MIDFEKIEAELPLLRERYLTAKPFEHLVIQDFCQSDKVYLALDEVPILENKSRDLIFAEGKFEKSFYYELGPCLREFHEDIHSKRFERILQFITNKEVFVDPKNHGGGLHQGRGNSKLDMHLDYNYHPINKNWWREVNLLFYMNKDWREEYGGHLDIRDLRDNRECRLPVAFNSLIIQRCDNYTLHGYKTTSFPSDIYRTSIATYAFVEHISQLEKPRTTDWFVDSSTDGHFKAFLGRNIHKLVRIKSSLFGSGTSKNT